jgi:hypothetical protein
MSNSASWRSTAIFVYKQKNDENLIGNKAKNGHVQLVVCIRREKVVLKDIFKIFMVEIPTSYPL